MPNLESLGKIPRESGIWDLKMNKHHPGKGGRRAVQEETGERRKSVLE